jgi:hypothetical protein
MGEHRAILLVRVSANLKARLTGMAKRERRSQRQSKQVELLLERYMTVLDKDGSSESRQKARQRKSSSPRVIGELHPPQGSFSKSAEVLDGSSIGFTGLAEIATQKPSSHPAAHPVLTTRVS